MAKGQFDQEQNNNIESFFPDFVKEMDKGAMGHALTRWKQTHASNILDSPLFLLLNFEKFPRKTWFEMIVWKFTNYRNQVYLKSEGVQQPQPPLMASTLKNSNPLLKFSSLMTGRELFALENHNAITSAGKQRALDTKNPSAAANHPLDFFGQTEIGI
ncbi:hypothetical protein B0H13DRAFT_2340452 [Mycena leptocephala]|nr:hypothetical protein B0H13DRAFT_2340452 [Mycena leptocephala]